MSPSEQGTTPNRKNKRSSRRLPAKGSTRAVAYGNALGLGRNIASGVLDVSETGARLLLNRRLADGAEFEVNFEGPGARPVKLHAYVVWSVEAADGRFVTGVRFEKALNYAALQALSRS
jgi:hypothetical protein